MFCLFFHFLKSPDIFKVLKCFEAHLSRDSWHEWQEDNLDEDQTRVLCLLCDNSYDLIEYLLKHLKVNLFQKFWLVA